MAPVALSELLIQLNTTHTAMLEVLLPDPSAPLPPDCLESSKTHATTLATKSVQLSNRLDSIRNQELRNESIALKEITIRLEAIISAQQSTITRFGALLIQWDHKLKELEEQSEGVLTRSDEQKLEFDDLDLSKMGILMETIGGAVDDGEEEFEEV